MVDYQKIIDYYYKVDDPLREILLVHSRQVADRALRICERHPELQLDRDFVEAAAMLHDIGIIRCDAPGIECYGTEPYICHGRQGAEMIRSLRGTLLAEDEVEPLARVCERHTGAGLSRHDIVERNLPLPQQDFMPETVAEQVICYADKFYSKTKLGREKTVSQAEVSLGKFGTEGVERFRKWVQLFE